MSELANLQSPVRFELKSNTPVDVLATTGNDYQFGMAINKGNALHILIDAQIVTADMTAKWYRRVTNLATEAWSLFHTATVTAGSVFSDDRNDVEGYFAVRVTVERTTGADQTFSVSASVTH